jgi:predicted phage terminase large subunit-like protein
VRRPGEVLHPEREPREVLDNMLREQGPDIFSAQYQQEPVPPGGALIKREWLRYYRQAPERDYEVTVIQSWDTAAKDGAQNDWSVCTTWMIIGNVFYLLDLTRGRYEYPLLRRTAIALAERYKPDAILIEDTSTGIALAQELGEILTYPVDPIPINRDKRGRLYIHQAQFAAGLVLFPEGADFLPALEMELLTFPQGKNDDQVDSISQALSYEPSGYDSSMRWVTGD